jgi:hypothetical protein
MGSEDQHKVLANANKQQKLFFLFALSIGLILFLSDFHVSQAALHEDFNDLDFEIASSELQSFENCSTAVPKVKAPSDFTTKPIWMSMAPFVISDSFHKELINPLTGTSAGGKSFYASMKGKLRHCIGNGQTVTCLNVHPGVEMNKGFPDSLSDKFYSKYILILRNPMTSFPATYNAKSTKYSGTVGQLPEENWREARDDWFEGMIELWKKTIVTWKETKNYDVGMYFVYEDLYDMKKGPLLMKNLRSFLIEAGFNVASEHELNCIWYNAVGEENLRRFRKLRYDYEDYIPGFTSIQKERILQELEDTKQKFTNDTQLVEILDRYIGEINSRLKIDVPATKSEK